MSDIESRSCICALLSLSMSIDSIGVLEELVMILQVNLDVLEPILRPSAGHQVHGRSVFEQSSCLFFD